MDRSRKKAVVTGASSGIGHAVAAGLRRDGYTVTTLQRRDADVQVDLRQHREIPVVWQRTLAAAGDIPDLVILNAGKSVDEPFISTSSGLIEDVLALNLVATLALAREAIRSWVHQGRSGHLILIGSQAALPGAKQAGNILYTASKGAVHAIVGPLATEYGPLVRVNCIAPGDVRTDAELELLQAKAALTGQAAHALEKKLVDEAALRRWVMPDEIYKGVAFLEQCTAMTGATLNISAGKSAH